MESIFWADLARYQINHSSKLVQTLVPYPAGTYADLVARALEPTLSIDGQYSSLVDSVPQNKGAYAIEIVGFSSPSNGAALLLAGSGLMILNRYVRLRKPLIPVCRVCRGPNLLVVAASSPFRTGAELISAARKNPNQFSYASSGKDSWSHVLGTGIAAAARISSLHLPAGSSKAAVRAVVRGKAMFLCDFVGNLLPYVRNGELRPIAVTSAARNSLLPDVPTVREIGLADCESEYWLAYLASGHTRVDLVERLNVALNSALNSAKIQQRLSLDGGVIVSGSTREHLAELLKAEDETIRSLAPSSSRRSLFSRISRKN